MLDELDAKLHPKLLRYIIRLFGSPEINRHGAQQHYTSHDLTTMRNTVFRRDEIWFAAEDEKHESHIYSLYDIRTNDNTHINNTAAYDKQYLEGRYGANPYLRSILDGGALVMSLHPIKRSDQNKEWNKGRNNKKMKLQSDNS